jgi:hypothetical protein
MVFKNLNFEISPKLRILYILVAWHQSIQGKFGLICISIAQLGK